MKVWAVFFIEAFSNCKHLEALCQSEAGAKSYVRDWLIAHNEDPEPELDEYGDYPAGFSDVLRIRETEVTP